MTFSQYVHSPDGRSTLITGLVVVANALMQLATSPGVPVWSVFFVAVWLGFAVTEYRVLRATMR